MSGLKTSEKKSPDHRKRLQKGISKCFKAYYYCSPCLSKKEVYNQNKSCQSTWLEFKYFFEPKLKIEVEVWSWGWSWSLKLKLEVEVWSWSLNLKFEVEVWRRSLKLKFEVNLILKQMKQMKHE